MASTSLTPSPANTPLPLVPNSLRRMASLWHQPAVRRVMPTAFVLLALSIGLTAYLALREPARITLFAGLTDADKAAVVDALTAGKIDVAVNMTTGAVQVPAQYVQEAKMLLASQGLPNSPATGYDLLSEIPLGTSRAIEQARLHQSKESELARSIMDINGIDQARVHLALPEATAFVRDAARPSAAVFVRATPGGDISDGQVTSITRMVSTAVPGLSMSDVSVVDQRGTLLSASTDASPVAESERQLNFRRQLERAWRSRISTILTPMFGADGFTTEVALDLDFSENQSTREAFDPASVIRSEQSSKTPIGATTAPSGIPGTLSNLAPPAAEATDPAEAPADDTAPPLPQNAAPATPTAENVTRNFEIGKEISVRKAAMGEIRRASVAVVLREVPDATGKQKKRSAAEIDAVRKLIVSAAGLDEKRGDTVTLSSTLFAPVPEATPEPLWQKPWVQKFAQSGAALLVLLLGLLFGVRPLVRALRTASGSPADDLVDAGAQGGKSAEMEASEIAHYHEKMTVVQDFVRSDEARATLALKEMLRRAEPAQS
jgi:flagellar M-ring protein FliF